MSEPLSLRDRYWRGYLDAYVQASKDQGGVCAAGYLGRDDGHGAVARGYLVGNCCDERFAMGIAASRHLVVR
ncbi:protein of unknown function [Streptomyces sp. KY70]|nr:protein of unknown function [Streptomyces sp. KY70]